MSPTPAHPRSFLATHSRALFAVGIVVHLVFLVSLVSGFLNPLFDDATHRAGQGADFYSIVQASQNMSDGISIYSRTPLRSVVPYSYVYRYLPFTAAVFGPVFRLVPPQVAYWTWVLLLELLLIVDLLVTRRAFADPDRARIAMCFWLLFTPHYLELYMGQFSFLMASLSFWAILLWGRRKEVAAGALWTLSVLLKTNSALFAPVLLKLGKWKTVLIAAGVVAALSIPYFVATPGSLQAFAWNFTEGLSVETLAGNQGLAALIASALLRLGGHWATTIETFVPNIPHMNEAVRTPLLLWALLVYGACLVLTLRARREYATELMVLWLLPHFLTYKHVWEHHYVMAVPAFVLLYRQAVTQESPVRVPPALLGIVFAVIALPTPFAWFDRAHVVIDPEFDWATWQSVLFHAGKPLALLALFLSLSVELWRHGKERPETAKGRSRVPEPPRRAVTPAAVPTR